MIATQSLEIYQILQHYFRSGADAQIVEDAVNQKKMLYLLTKDDKVTSIDRVDNTKFLLVNRMDSHFKWLVGIMITLFGITITLILKKWEDKFFKSNKQ